MGKVMVVCGAVGVMGSLMALLGLGMALAREGRWGPAVSCVAAMASILFLLILGLEYADEFWKGRS